MTATEPDVRRELIWAATYHVLQDVAGTPWELTPLVAEHLKFTVSNVTVAEVERALESLRDENWRVTRVPITSKKKFVRRRWRYEFAG